MSRKKPRTWLTDLQNWKRNRHRLHEALQQRQYAELAVKFLDAYPEVRRDLLGFYLEAKERLEESDSD